MDLTQHVEALRHQLELAAAAGGEDARAVADRLIGALDSATRLVLLDALAAAAAEITLELAPGSVDVRLRGREPEFVVTAPTSDAAETGGQADALVRPLAGSGPIADADESGPSRITLRLPEHLKGRIEEAAGREGVSVNSWLVRVIVASVGSSDQPRRSGRSGLLGGQSFTGWAR